MILSKMKDIEDAKQELAQLNDEYYRAYESDKARIFSELKEQFKSFVVNAGFSFSERGSSLLAQYGKLELKLTFPNLDDNFMGAMTVLQFENSNQKVLWNLAIINSKSTRGAGVSFSSRQQDELAKLRSDIEEAKSRLPYTPLEYAVSYKISNTKNLPVSEPSLESALTAILENK